jgi:hypothetical protein
MNWDFYDHTGYSVDAPAPLEGFPWMIPVAHGVRGCLLYFLQHDPMPKDQRAYLIHKVVNNGAAQWFYQRRQYTKKQLLQDITPSTPKRLPPVPYEDLPV